MPLGVLTSSMTFFAYGAHFDAILLDAEKVRCTKSSPPYRYGMLTLAPRNELPVGTNFSCEFAPVGIFSPPLG
jgi:hypothetical protein